MKEANKQRDLRGPKQTFIVIGIFITIICLNVGNLYGIGISPKQNGEALSDNLLLQREVTGTVVDQDGQPLIGVNILLKGTSRGTTTDENGEFSIEVENDQAVLVFRYIGFKEKEVKVGDQTTLEVTMTPTAETMEEMVVVGYGTQSEQTLSGSISQIQSMEIVTTRNENPQNMLAGKIPGVRVDQQSAEPGDFNTLFDIRGFGDPLVVIDGVPRENFSYLNPEDIANISVLKDASAAVYGVRAANGVILVETKDGKATEGLNMTYQGEYTIQKPSGSPESVSAANWMVLANEQGMHDPNNPRLRFTQEQIEAYRTGERQGTDWYDTVIRPTAPQTKHNFSASGGNEDIQFYSSFGYQYQESFFRNDLNYDKFNLRTNITSQLTDDIELDLKVHGITDQKYQPFANSNDIIHVFQRANPTVPIYANNTEPFYQEGRVDGSNAVAMMNSDYSGYRELGNKWFQSSVTLTYSVPHVDGLEAKGKFSYDYSEAENKLYSPKYDQYRYNDASETYREITHQAPSTIERQYFTDQDYLYQVSLNYEQTFKKSHNVTGLILGEGSKRQGDNFFSQRELLLGLDELFAGISEDQVANMFTGSDDIYEEANLGLVGRLAYNYDRKYMTEFSFRYDGSSKFPEGERWGFFPSASVAWRISKEDFWTKSALNFINNAKIRASYGVLGDDNASSYQFITGYQYPAGGINDELPGGHVFDGNYINAAENLGIPNRDITWFTSHTLNIGLDLDAWDERAGISIDVFERERDGLLATRVQSLPSIVGANLPQENLNGDRTRGFEIEAYHEDRFEDFRYKIKGNVSFTRTRNTNVERARSGNSFMNWRTNPNDRYQGIWWGYATDGRYESYEEISNSDVYVDRSTLPGDYKYEDWNEDGIISDKDVHPISYNGTPRINFGFNLDFVYKAFNLNMHFQGAAMNYVVYSGSLFQPMWGHSESNALEMFMDRWHPKDPTADPYDPNTEWNKGEFAYTGTTPRRDSYHAINKGDYIRLKSLNLGYQIPSVITNRAGLKSARVNVSGYNLLTFTRMDYIDPEHPDDDFGNLYPLNKTFTFGLNIEF